MRFILTILLAILIFGMIIALHEFGHFIAAKWNGVQVNEFAIGMGPRILKFQRGETLYSLRCLPIGGFCAMEGEDNSSENPRAFHRKKVWQRMTVVLAGPIMNILLGFVLLLVTTATDPYLLENTIHSFHNASESSHSLEAGDRILSMNGSHIFTITDLQHKLQSGEGKPFTVVVKRDGERITLKNVQFADAETGGQVDFYLEKQKKTPLTVTGYAARDTVATARLIWSSLGDLVSGEYGVKDLSGPVGTVTVIHEAATTGETLADRISTVLHLTIFITINVGIFNLLPIPGLDGSRFLFLILEAVRRKPIPKEREAMVHLFGMVALFALMIVVTVQDIGRLL